MNLVITISLSVFVNVVILSHFIIPELHCEMQ